jgi:hypothetical protein
MPFYDRDSLRNRRPDWVDENDPLFITLCHKRRWLHYFDNPKAWSALLAAAKHAKDTGRWQKGSFDHRIRSHEHYLEKRDYVLMNPVRAGLVSKTSEWPYAAWWKTKGYERPEEVREIFGD